MATPSHDLIYYLRSLLHRHSNAGESDRELLRRFMERCGDDAFTALLRRHGPMVLNLARRITGDKQLAEDVFQATFLLLSQKAGTIRRPEALPCWLHGVARRLAVQTRSTQLRCQRQEARRPPSLPSNPLDELTAQEFLTVLDEELTKLPENYRAPLILCCLEGLSQEEAAQRLGCSAGALRGRLERGRQRLRLRLEKRGLTLPAVFGGTLLFAGATSAVPEALAHVTLQAAKPGGNVGPAVALLIQEAMRSMVFSKLNILGAAMILLALAGAGVGMMALRPQAAKEKSLPAVTDSTGKPLSLNKRVDLYGDPLPKGAVMRLGTLQRRAVNAQLAVTADGQSIVCVRDGKYVTIWDAATGQHRQSREVPSKITTANDHGDNYALSPDGRLLATSVITDGKVTIWDVRSGRVIRELVLSKADFISNIAFSPDGELVAANGRIGRGFVFGPGGNRAGNEEKQMLRVWRLSDGQEIFSTDLRQNWACDFFALSRDGKLLIASFNSKEEGTYCWSLAEKRLRWQSKDFADASMLLTPDGKLFSQRQAKALDLVTGKPAEIEHLPSIAPHNRAVFSPDGRTLLFSTPKGAVVWDMVRGQQLRTLDRAGEQFVFLPDGKTVVTNKDSLQCWDLATGKPQWSDTFALGHVGEVVALAFSADGRRLASGSTDGSVRLWDVRTGRPLRVWRGPEESTPLLNQGRAQAGVQTLDISADGRRVVSAGAGERLQLWDAASDKAIRILPLPPRKPPELDRNISQLRFSTDNRRIVGLFFARVEDGKFGKPMDLIYQVAVWDAATADLLEEYSTEEKVSGLAWEWGILAADARTLLTRTAMLDVKSSKRWTELPERSTRSGPGAFCFSDDVALAAGDAEKLSKVNDSPVIGPDGARVWETATGKIIARLKTISWVPQTIFLSNNRYLVFNDFTGILVRDLRDGEPIARFEMPESIVAARMPGSYAGCLAFTRDGRRMATGHPDSTILVWDVPLPPSQAVSVPAEELESLWTDLADADAAKAWRAVWRLADAPKDTLPFLRGRVKPSPAAPADEVRKLLSDLDNDSFRQRESATKRLQELGLQIQSELRAALKAKPSPEQKRRIEDLLAALPAAPSPPTPEELRQLRALIVLERIATPEARRLLEDAAKGPSSSRVTRQARAALACFP